MTRDDDARRTGEHQPLGQMPGVNQAPMNPSFREGPQGQPDARPWLRLVVIGVVAAGVALVAWLVGAF